jgi:hypothetical protein
MHVLLGTDEQQVHSKRGQLAALTTHEGRNAAIRRRREALAGVIAGVALLYPDGRIYARDTWVWKELADITGATEAELTTIAAAVGHWPWNKEQILRAVRDGTDDGAPVEAITDEERALFHKPEPAEVSDPEKEEWERYQRERRARNQRNTYRRRREAQQRAKEQAAR